MSYNRIRKRPGQGTEREAINKVVILNEEVPVLMKPRGGAIDGTLARDLTNTGDEDVLLAGCLVGLVSATGKYANSVIGCLESAVAASGTTLVVGTAVAEEIVRRIGTSGTIEIYGPATAGATVGSETLNLTAVDTGAGELTVDATVAAYLEGSFITADDGSGDIKTFVSETYGITVTDEKREDMDAPFELICIGGAYVEVASLTVGQLAYDSLDSSLQAFIKQSLREHTVGFAFRDDFE